ncbi:hypothetical protein BX659_103111 [Orenia metallireducens]|jgi:hypothetical protein|uniref:Uncharacterized protein n=1 Tax=Orenia metallireducens TaxID=1413210 RepID=A0A285FM08_9FIRM|nr:hypothetical protein BX659_103111 [Orenia metallireducens]SNY11366.1 hypothetical protein SAMN06265827_102111 [Orenia metallireducens]
MSIIFYIFLVIIVGIFVLIWFKILDKFGG